MREQGWRAHLFLSLPLSQFPVQKSGLVTAAALRPAWRCVMKTDRLKSVLLVQRVKIGVSILRPKETGFAPLRIPLPEVRSPRRKN